MGANQSSAGQNSGSSQEVKTSYYELLAVSRSATEEELKKAYRKKALELHPDRNYGNEEAATKIFAEVRAAYEVLSDPQERAWYDSHESAILRGDDASAVGGEGGGGGEAPMFDNVRVTTADDLTRTVRKFNSNVEFSDAPSGFFGFVRDTFERLAREEEIAASWENVEVREYPSFGHRDDEYGDVVKQFYAAWAGFSTVKTFAWKDRYRLSEAPDRWYRRRMEQENQRLRQDGKREFNDAVRSLVAFIRKRDPRYVPSTQTEAERQQTLRDAAAAQAARARAANEAKIQSTDVPEWTKIHESDELLESEEEEESEQEVLECVACNKTFKSEKQWEAHEKSKKHQKAVRSLQQRMRKQNISLDLDSSNEQKDAEKANAVENDEEDIIISDVDHDEAQTNGSANDEDEIDDDHDTNENTKENVYADDSNAEKPPDARLEERPPGEKEEEESDSHDEDHASLETIQARMQSASIVTPSDSDEEAKPAKPKMGKAAQKRAKKAAASAAAQQNEAEHKCEVCNGTFPSKTKLFQHIKDEGHAALKSTVEHGGSKSSKKGKKKR